VVKEKFPDMPVIAEDSHGGSVADVERWSEYADIGSFQAQYHSGDAATQSYAYVTKLARDLSGLDYILVCPHDLVGGFPNGDLQPEEVRELYGQIFRGGGTGFNFWPASYGAKKPNPPYAPSVVVGHPFAWRYMIAVAKLARRMPPLKFPKPDTAVFVSSETIKCGVNPGTRNLDAFTQLGVHARAAFRFISEGLLELKRVKLDDFDIVYVTSMRYTQRSVAEKLQQFVERGGILVCADPLALENDIASASLADIREKLLAAKVKGKKEAATRIAFQKPFVRGVRELPVFTDSDAAYVVETSGPRATVLAAFDDGGPALVRNRLGKGATYYFAWCPFNARTRKNADRKKFITNFHRKLGGSAGHDIWRFKIPALVQPADRQPEGVCLTGNYGEWDYYRFIEGRRYNADTGGKYTIEAYGQQLAYPLSDGPLTNRLLLQTRDVYGSTHPIVWHEQFVRGEWAEEFTGRDPVRVTFDFKKTCAPTRVKIFVSGEFAGMTAETTPDGKTWRAAGRIRGVATGKKEVLSRQLHLTPVAAARYVRLSLHERTSAKSALVIPEIEVWGK